MTLFGNVINLDITSLIKNGVHLHFIRGDIICTAGVQDYLNNNFFYTNDTKHQIVSSCGCKMNKYCKYANEQSMCLGQCYAMMVTFNDSYSVIDVIKKILLWEYTMIDITSIM